MKRLILILILAFPLTGRSETPLGTSTNPPVVKSDVTLQVRSGGGMDFNAGSTVDFTGATVTGLDSGGSGLTGGTSGHVVTASGATTIADSGTALSSLAIDSAVVHKTGSETISGTKNFSSAIKFDSSISSQPQILGNTFGSNGGASLSMDDPEPDENIAGAININGGHNALSYGSYIQVFGGSPSGGGGIQIEGGDGKPGSNQSGGPIQIFAGNRDGSGTSGSVNIYAGEPVGYQVSLTPSGFKFFGVSGWAPTASGLFGYDSTSNTFKGGVNGSTKTIATTTDLASYQPLDSNLTTLVTSTKGDLIYSSATNTLSKLSGNTTSNKKFLSQTGTGVISAAPVWGDISLSEITQFPDDPTTEADFNPAAWRSALLTTGTVTDTMLANAVKPAVAVVATSNLTLSGEQTIDGQLTSGSLVLCTAQSTGSQNGAWISAAGAWSRPGWYTNGSTTQAPQFLTTFVRLGTTYQGSTWRMTTASVTIGTTSTTWVQTPTNLNSVTGTLSGSSVSGGTFGAVNGSALTALNASNLGSGTAGVGIGGTGLTSYVVGDLLYASGSTTLSKLADVATGNALISGGITTAPSWGKITSGHVDSTVATVAGSETLTNKTLATPKFASGGFIADANGNEQIIFTTTASAVNELTLANAATGGNPAITLSGGDTNISLTITPKGTGYIEDAGGLVVGSNHRIAGDQAIEIYTTLAKARARTVSGRGLTLDRAGLHMASGAIISLASVASNNDVTDTFTGDTGLSRDSAGVWAIGTGAAGNLLGAAKGTFIAAGTATTCTGGTIGTGSKNNAGFVTATTTGTSTVVVTFSFTAPTGWTIMATDITSGVQLTQSAKSTTTATFTGLTTSGDVIQYMAMAY